MENTAIVRRDVVVVEKKAFLHCKSQYTLSSIRIIRTSLETRNRRGDFYPSGEDIREGWKGCREKESSCRGSAEENSIILTVHGLLELSIPSQVH
jgi:hypothetical protein